jgi:hypothetical protein
MYFLSAQLFAVSGFQYCVRIMTFFAHVIILMSKYEYFSEHLVSHTVISKKERQIISSYSRYPVLVYAHIIQQHLIHVVHVSGVRLRL